LSLLFPLYSLVVVLLDPCSSSLPFYLIEALQPLTSSMMEFSLLFMSFSPLPPPSALAFFSSPLSFTSSSFLFNLPSPSSSVSFPLPFLYLSITLNLLHRLQKKSRVSFFPPSKIIKFLEKTSEYLGLEKIPVNSVHSENAENSTRATDFLVSIAESSLYSENYSRQNSELRSLFKLVVWVLEKKLERLRGRRRDEKVRQGEDKEEKEEELENVLNWILKIFMKCGTKNPKFWQILGDEFRFSTILRLLYLWISPALGSPPPSLIPLNAITLLFLQNRKTGPNQKFLSKILEKQSAQILMAEPWTYV
jgi:hypothetical protein